MTHGFWFWYWKIKKKHIAKQLCSALPTIDSFSLYKQDKLPLGFIVQPVDVSATQTPDKLIITYRKQKNSPYTISVEKLPCHYGGFRYFFRCPICTKRMRLLYFVAQSIFLCRKCLNLSYDSQRLHGRPIVTIT